MNPSPNDHNQADHQDSKSMDQRGQSLTAVIVFVAIALVVLVGDLVSKSLAFSRLPDNQVILTADNATDSRLFAHDPVVVVPKILNLHLTTNTGAVFGIGKGSQVFFILVSVMAVCLISWFFWNSKRGAWMHLVSLAMILGGALGNLYDRICFNAVRDLLHLFPGVKLPFGLHWPGGSDELYPWIFNIADVGLVVGVIILAGVILFGGKQQPNDEKAAD